MVETDLVATRGGRGGQYGGRGGRGSYRGALPTHQIASFLIL